MEETRMEENTNRSQINQSPHEIPLHHSPNPTPQLSISNGGGVCELKLSMEEVKGAMEIMASTGKFWHDWEELKCMLIFQMKQVLSEYPEAMMSDVQQKSSLGESYTQLVKRLEEALLSFMDGPPFTLQRVCEILLNARTIYPNLSKLALALVKNLLVTSTITKSTDPYPPPIVQAEELVENAPPESQNQSQPHQLDTEPLHPLSNSAENGREPMTEDRVEEFSEVHAEVDDRMAIDMETLEEIISSSNTTSETVKNS